MCVCVCIKSDEKKYKHVAAFTKVIHDVLFFPNNITVVVGKGCVELLCNTLSRVFNILPIRTCMEMSRVPFGLSPRKIKLKQKKGPGLGDQYSTIFVVPVVVLEVESVNMFFFLSLSSKDVNSSSEPLESSSLEGAESVRLGERREVAVQWVGRGAVKGETGGKNGDGGLSFWSKSNGLFSLDFAREFGFVQRVLQVLLITKLSPSSSLSLMNTGEAN